MSAPEIAASVETVPLRRGRGSIAFHATGFRHPGRFRRERFTDYQDVTHLLAGGRGLRVGTRTTVFALPRAAFVSPTGADRVQRLLVEHIAQLPEGPMQLLRFAELDQQARAELRIPVVAGVALLCVAGWIAELVLGPSFSFAGFFSRTLVMAGDWWRLVTANLLHGGVVHLATNVLVLVGIGSLVERPLGSARTFFVVALSALTGMGSGLLAGYEQAVGASGIAAGLVGAALYLELRFPDRLPVSWRISRRWLLLAILAETLISLAVTFIAGAAHAAGFGAGFLACALVAPPALQRRPVGIPMLATNAFFAGLVVLAIGAMGREVLGTGDAVAHRAERLLRLPEVDPQILNKTAWTLATEGKPDERALGMALQLAERAVEATDSRDPNVLDTLAEVHFQSGRNDEAVAVIDAAIELAPQEPYFREQRRRFTGDRAAGDRPEAPDLLMPAPGSEAEEEDEDSDDPDPAPQPDFEPDEPDSEEEDGPIRI
jgi:rhomboid protease GluP